MPDWKKLVREHMESNRRPLESCEEVVSELGAHLEEAYENARAAGLTETEALKRALQEVGDWRVLAKNISRATRQEEKLMNHRTKSLWLPALTSLAAASLFLLVLTRISLQPQNLVRLNSGLGRSFYLGWLCAQVWFGALGAFLSRRAGGTRTARVVAGTFPAIVLFALWALVIPASAIVERNLFVLHHRFYYALGIFVWVVPPAIALLLGAAPFLKEPHAA